MTTKSKGKKGKGKSKKGSGGPKQAPFDAAASLLRMESVYDEICKDAIKQEESEYENFDTITTEYVVTARSTSAKAPPRPFRLDTRLTNCACSTHIRRRTWI